MAKATKQDLINALTAAGIALEGEETVAELKALVEANSVVVQESDSTDDVQFAKVLDKQGKTVNVYSSADNDDYQERAQRLADKVGGSVVAA
jgi:hypothetical protein